ncbi:hypothetical protein [Streptomyces sp. NPDC048442]|uniref:hypothetical protein n=1 Tax=Streptomyces sp. NPDC048442 TaxID=3154823 RepID=UPI00344067A4
MNGPEGSGYQVITEGSVGGGRRDVPFGDGRWIEVAPPGATTLALVPEGVPTGIRLTTRDADA